MAVIPYGFGGVISGAQGGTPNLPDMSRFISPVRNIGMPGGNLAQLVSQMNLSPTGPTSAFPRVTSGWAGADLLGGFKAPVSGPASAFRGALSEVPVSIRMGASAPLDAGLVAKLGTGAVEGEAALASGAKGLLGGIKSKLPFVEGGATLGQFAKGAVGPLIASVALNKAGGMAGGDESFLGRALKGAGTGAIGFSFGPEIGIPATVISAGLNAFFGGKKGDKTPVWLEEETLDRAGFSDVDKSQIRMTYDILKETQGEDAAKTAIGQIIMQDITTRKAQEQEDISSQRRMLATQALASQFFQPFTKQMLDSAQQRYQVSESVAKDLPPEYRSIMRAQNAASLDNANRVATAYAAQAQMIPQMAAVDYQKSIADQLAQQQAATVIQNLYGGGASGAGSLTDLASQAALQQAGQGG